MKIRLWNNDSTDSCIFEAETIEEIREQAKSRIKLPTWKDGWSEKVKD